MSKKGYMITQKRVWEIMSKECKYKDEKECVYYGRTNRYCKCETCPLLGLAGQDFYKQES